MSVWPPQGTDVSIRPPRVPTLAKGPHLSGYSKGEHLVLGKSIAHDMKSGAEGAHFFGSLLLTFSFDKHNIEKANMSIIYVFLYFLSTIMIILSFCKIAIPLDFLLKQTKCSL